MTNIRNDKKGKTLQTAHLLPNFAGGKYVNRHTGLISKTNQFGKMLDNNDSKRQKGFGTFEKL